MEEKPIRISSCPVPASCPGILPCPYSFVLAVISWLLCSAVNILELFFTPLKMFSIKSTGPYQYLQKNVLRENFRFKNVRMLMAKKDAKTAANLK